MERTVAYFMLINNNITLRSTHVLRHHTVGCVCMIDNITVCFHASTQAL